VADELGNTPAVARASYVSPVVIERFQEGVTLEHVRQKSERVVSASRGTLEPEEESLVALLRR
jgi:DNA topoisomerase-1